MTPAQVCTLLAVMLGTGSGAPLAQPVPAAAAPPLHRMIAQRQTPAAQPAEQAWPPGDASASDPTTAQPGQPEYDYFVYEYEDYEYDDTPPTTEPSQSGERSSGGASSETEPPDIGRASEQTEKHGSEKENGLRGLLASLSSVRFSRKTGSSTSTTSTLPRSTTEAMPTTLAVASGFTTTPTASEGVQSTIGGGTGVGASSDTATPSSPAREPDHHNLVEQEISGSARVVTFHLQDLQHQRVTKSARDPPPPPPPPPRETPQFFVPPIRRKAARRRVSLTTQNRSGPSSSLGARLAEQVRQQLAQLQAEEEASGRQQWTGAAAERQPQQQNNAQRGESTPTTTTQAPTTSTTPATTTAKSYKHPFIPSSPTTTSEPYKHPFIPKSPTTTSEPYRHPFIPSSPTTTSQPYKHPFIPSPPTTTSQPYKHPFIPVPPETTGRPHGGPHGEAAVVPTSSPRPSPSPRPPQARRIPDSVVPRLHLPRRKPTPAPAQASSTPSSAAAAARSSAKIVHEERVQEGFIVGEYGELRGGGTVRGVKYRATSDVDRSLLEAALQQFLQL